MPKARTTCTRCSRRHQSCDRNVPCLRCVKAGEAESCKKEWEGGYDAKICRTYLPTRRPNRPGTNDGQQSEEGGSSSADTTPAPLRNHNGAPVSPESVDSSSPAVHRGVQDISTGIEDVKLRDTIDTHLDAKYTNMGPSQPVVIDSDSVELNPVRTIKEMQLLLPSTAGIKQLVLYHEHCLAWYHGNICVQIFNEELAEALETTGDIQLANLDLRWCAMLFSIMTQSLTCANDRALAAWGYDKRQKVALGRQWFECTVSCLNRGKYTSRPSIHSVHAIASLAMSAHPLGFSTDQFILYGNAMRIAQSIRLQYLPHDPEKDDIDEATEPPNSAKRRMVRKREEMRRVWMLLCTQDWFMATYTGMYWLHRDQFLTTAPRPFDDERMGLARDDVPTGAAFSMHIQRMAAITARFADAVRGERDLARKYDKTRAFDGELRTMAVSNLPPPFQQYKDRPWIRWGTNITTILLASKLLLMHRPFLNKSFTDDQYAYTRWASVDASKTIMSECQIAAMDRERPTFWNDHSFLVSAAITLSLDILHRSPKEPEFNEHRKLVETAQRNLRLWADRSVIASRGVRVLSSLWKEVSNYHRSRAPPRPVTQPQQQLPITPPTLPPSLAHSSHNTNQIGWQSLDHTQQLSQQNNPQNFMPWQQQQQHNPSIVSVSQPQPSNLLLAQPFLQNQYPLPLYQPPVTTAHMSPSHMDTSAVGYGDPGQPQFLDSAIDFSDFNDVSMQDGWLVPDLDPIMDLAWMDMFPNQFPMTGVEGEMFVNDLFRSAMP